MKKIFILLTLLILSPLAVRAANYNATPATIRANSPTVETEPTPISSSYKPSTAVDTVTATSVDDDNNTVTARPTITPITNVGQVTVGSSGREVKTETLIEKNYAKCGVNTFSITEECGLNAYKAVYYACYDGYSAKQGGEASCKSARTWQEYAEQACAGHCSLGYIPHTAIEPMIIPVPNTDDSQDSPVRDIAPSAPAPVIIADQTDTTSTTCDNLIQWQKKIAYYEKLGQLEEAELKTGHGFAKQEVEKILTELRAGADKIARACTDPTVIVTEIKPIAADSGQEIARYYETQLEKIQSENQEDYQQDVTNLKIETQELTANFIKSRQEIEARELTTITPAEIKISPIAISVGDTNIPTLAKKILLNTNTGVVTIKPAGDNVIISDKEIDVIAPEISVKNDIISLNNQEIKMNASAVAEKLAITPQIVNLTTEGNQAVYNIQVQEKRKLFGFIPVTVKKVIVADTDNGEVVREDKPWYSFLTSAR